MVKKFGHLTMLGIVLAAVISAGASSLRQLSTPAIIPKQCASPTCFKASDCGACFCNFDFGTNGQGTCMIEPLAKNKTNK